MHPHLLPLAEFQLQRVGPQHPYQQNEREDEKRVVWEKDDDGEHERVDRERQLRNLPLLDLFSLVVEVINAALQLLHALHEQLDGFHQVAHALPDTRLAPCPGPRAHSRAHQPAGLFTHIKPRLAHIPRGRCLLSMRV